MIVLGTEKDLRFMHQSSERLAMSYAITVTLKLRTQSARLDIMISALRF
jgi:hypothetical protein